MSLIIKLLITIIIILHPYIFNYTLAKNNNYSVQVIVNIVDQEQSKDKEIAETIKSNLPIYSVSSEKHLSLHRIENLHHQSKHKITYYLESFGYYHAKIIKSSLQLSKQIDDEWIASYTIDLGLPILIKKIEFKTTKIISKQLNTLIQNSIENLIATNQILEHSKYEKAKHSILMNLNDHGFLNAQFIRSNVEIDLQKNSAVISYIVDPKQQYYFGPITFESDLYKKDFLYKYLSFKEKEPYSNILLTKLKNDLLNSKLFSKVRIDIADPDLSSNNVIPITIRVYANPNNKYNGSIGIGTDTGLRLTAGYQRKRKNHPGHIFSISFIGAKIRQQLIADYSFLYNNPITDKYHLGVISTKNQIQQIFNKNQELYLKKTKKLTNKEQLWKIHFLKEKFTELPGLPEQKLHFLMINTNINWKYKINNKGKNHTSRNQLNLVVKGANKFLSSSANLFQLTINEKFVDPLMFDLKLIYKGTLAKTFIKDLIKLPVSLRFFAGGDDSIRGFAYNTLGPVKKDDLGNKYTIGGKNLFLTSLEIEKTILEQPSIALSYFIDLGNALNNFKHLKLNQLAIGTGIGVSYNTPIGSIRSYIAKPIRNPVSTATIRRNLRIHVTFVTDF